MSKQHKRLAAGHDRRQPGYFQIDNEVFSMGLAPHDFTAYCFMVRRFGDGTRGVYSSVGNMAKEAGMSRARFFTAINKLLELNMIAITEQRHGHTTHYDLLDKSEWHQPVHEIDTPRPRGRRGGVHEVDTKKKPAKKKPEEELKHVNASTSQVELTPELATTLPSELTPSGKVDYEAFGHSWNELRGSLPGIMLPLSADRRKAVDKLIQKHKGDSLEMFRAAVQAVARNDFWIKRRYGFNNLLRGKVEHYAEQWQHSGDLTGADVKLLTRAQRIAQALGDDE